MGGHVVRGQHDGGAAGCCVAERAECYGLFEVGEVSYMVASPVVGDSILLVSVSLSAASPGHWLLQEGA